MSPREVFEALAQDADNEYAVVDATIVRAHQHSAGTKKRGLNKQAIGRRRGGLSTKIHTAVDTLGKSTGFHLTPGQTHGLEGSDVLIEDTRGAAIVADKACDAHARLVQPLLDRSKEVVIPPYPMSK